jgi:hypothetical protein
MAGEGVVGLKELGAREMSYRLMFVACSTKVRQHKQLGKTALAYLQQASLNALFSELLLCCCQQGWQLQGTCEYAQRNVCVISRDSG